MDKKKKEMLVIGVLAVVFCYVIYSSLLAPKKKPPVTAPDAAEKSPPPQPAGGRPAAPASTVQAAIHELPPLDEKLIQMQLARSEQPWGRDPFNPPPTPAMVEEAGLEWQAFRLTGVIPGPVGGTAVINGQVVGTGETFRGYILREIQTDRIVLERNGESFIIKMLGE